MDPATELAAAGLAPALALAAAAVATASVSGLSEGATSLGEDDRVDAPTARFAAFFGNFDRIGLVPDPGASAFTDEADAVSLTA